jgi:hypothetical protein
MLTLGQASDLEGFDALVETIGAEALIADNGYDAAQRVRAVLAATGKTAVIPPRHTVRDQPGMTKGCTRSATTWRTFSAV